MQHKTTSQTKYLYITMKLEASPVGKTSAGMVQIQTQSTNRTLRFQDIKNGKEIREKIQCPKCKA